MDTDTIFRKNKENRVVDHNILGTIKVPEMDVCRVLIVCGIRMPGEGEHCKQFREPDARRPACADNRLGIGVNLAVIIGWK